MKTSFTGVGLAEIGVVLDGHVGGPVAVVEGADHTSHSRLQPGSSSAAASSWSTPGAALAAGATARRPGLRRSRPAPRVCGGGVLAGVARRTACLPDFTLARDSIFSKLLRSGGGLHLSSGW